MSRTVLHVATLFHVVAMHFIYLQEVFVRHSASVA
jgi:hypothetical protein